MSTLRSEMVKKYFATKIVDSTEAGIFAKPHVEFSDLNKCLSEIEARESQSALDSALIEQLEKDIAVKYDLVMSHGAQIIKLKKALEFYAKEANWHPSSCNTFSIIGKTDLDNSSIEFTQEMGAVCNIGGKRAREALK